MSLAGHEASVVVFLAVLLAFSLANLLWLPRLRPVTRQSSIPTPWVSILVPARNEEMRIGDCVRSLLLQDYPTFEVLVLDDGSTDGTRRVLEQFAADPRLRVLVGKPLPPGWMGKNWACHQLAHEARGDLFLFTDADTRHDRSCLRAAVATMEAEHVAFLSALPRQEMGSWGERVLVPILSWTQQTFFPLVLLRRIPWSQLATAVGQYILVRRDAYVAAGGHERIRSSVVDDWDLVRAVAATGRRWTLCDGSGLVAARMYGSLRDAVNGFSKNLYARFGYNLPWFTFVWSWLLWVTWQPIILLLVRAFGGGASPDAAIWAGLAVALNLVLWAIADLRFGVAPLHVFLYPATVLVACFVAARSLLWRALGRGTWKGRPLLG